MVVVTTTMNIRTTFTFTFTFTFTTEGRTRQPTRTSSTRAHLAPTSSSPHHDDPRGVRLRLHGRILEEKDTRGDEIRRFFARMVIQPPHMGGSAAYSTSLALFGGGGGASRFLPLRFLLRGVVMTFHSIQALDTSHIKENKGSVLLMTRTTHIIRNTITSTKVISMTGKIVTRRLHRRRRRRRSSSSSIRISRRSYRRGLHPSVVGRLVLHRRWVVVVGCAQMWRLGGRRCGCGYYW